MKALGRGCLQLLIVWAAAGYALYYFAFHERFTDPGDMYGSIIGGLLVAFAYGSFYNAFHALRQRKLITRARAGVVLEDGKQMAAIGPIKALRGPILTPFRKKECVAYGYDIHRRVTTTTGSGSNRSTSTSKQTYMGGMAMTPCAIRTSIAEVKILGFAMPDDFPEETFLASEYRQQIGDYCANTKFGSTEGFSFSDISKQLKNILTEDDGDLKEDWRSPTLENYLDGYPDETMAMEQYIPNGAQVCVFGKYSAAKGGLLSDLSKGGLEILSGDASAAYSKLRSRAILNFVMSVIFFALGTVAVYFILKAREGSSDIVEIRRKQLESAVAEGRTEDVSKMIKLGTSVKLPPDALERTLSGATTPEMMKLLIEQGIDINGQLPYGMRAIHQATFRDDASRVKMLLDHGADPNLKTEYGSTPAEIAFDAGNQEILGMIQRAGGKGQYVSAANGRPISEKSDELAVIREYLAAHVAQESAGVRATTDSWPADFYESFERGTYQGTRSAQFRFLYGFTDGAVSTVVLQFLERPMLNEVWVYTLVKRGDEWKIRRESWDEDRRWPDAP